MFRDTFRVFLLAISLSIASGMSAQEINSQDSLQVFFGTGSAQIKSDQQTTLDQAARLFREGNPFVMIISGGADTVGTPDNNLRLSLKRAQAVADGLSDRGIPTERLQVLGRGVSELAVETASGVSEERNRVAEITWR